MLVHHRVTPSIKFAGAHLYTWVERGTVRVKCLAQEHNTMSQARAWTQTTRSGVKRTNCEAAARLNSIKFNFEVMDDLKITVQTTWLFRCRDEKIKHKIDLIEYSLHSVMNSTNSKGNSNKPHQTSKLYNFTWSVWKTRSATGVLHFGKLQPGTIVMISSNSMA